MYQTRSRLRIELCRWLVAMLYRTARSQSLRGSKLTVPGLSFPDGLTAEHQQHRE